MAYPSDLNRPLAQLAASGVWDALDGGTLVVACSGGPDSVALALAARELLAGEFAQRFRRKPHLVLWHLDHKLREESGKDAEFVRELGKEWGVAVIVEEVASGELVGNIEGESRRVRYARLLTLLRGEGGGTLAQPARGMTAHHLNDQAETILHHILRGTHLAGLRGIAPVYHGLVFRPWLGISRAEIIAFLESRKQDCVTDPSNADVGLTRNRLRHEVLPLLTQVNPRAVEHIAQLSAAADEALALRAQRLEQLEVCVFHPTDFASWLPLLAWPEGYSEHWLWGGWEASGQLAQYVATHIFGDSGLESADYALIQEWADDPGGPLRVHGKIIELIAEQVLTVSEPAKHQDTLPELKLDQPELHWEGLRITLADDPQQAWALAQHRDRHVWANLRHWPEALAALCASPPKAPAWECFLTGAALPLRLRTWRVGERMQLAGGGSATIGDLFTNAKVPEPLRAAWAVLADADDNALWLPGIADGAAMRIPQGQQPELLVRIQQTSPP